jgi:poly-gamma-glutamate synthesis protein (capsule biosynthesis protein)
MISVLIAGDFCPQRRVAALFDKGDYASVLGEIRSSVMDADYRIVNFECPVSEGNGNAIVKKGPNLRCTEKGLEAVRWVGFDCVTLANNHFYDYGDDGVTNTLAACKKYGLDTVGGGMNFTEASKVLYREIGGKTLAIVNCCEHESSIATNKSAGSNPLNPIDQYYSIIEAKELADYVLVIVHGGHEMWQLPSPRMVQTYRFFIDAGADAVVNHHQHCFSGYEVYNGKPIFYGLGNFCFDKPDYYKGLWELGYMVRIHLAETISFDILPYEQCKKDPVVHKLDTHEEIDRKMAEINEIIADDNKLSAETARYYSKNPRSVRLAFEPYHGRVCSKLFLSGLLPGFMTKKKLIALQNSLECESHRDRILYHLNHMLAE